MKNMMNSMKKSLIFLPTPINISSWWNYGFILGTTLLMQLITGLFLSLHYCPNSLMAFSSVMHIIRDVNSGWLFQIMHANGASLFFIMIYIHIARGIYFSLYKNMLTWLSGFMILSISMLVAFLGYVLPWGQMSFWGATVITNLMSTIPLLGEQIVFWIWGGYAVDNSTLSRFFIFHFIMPFSLIIMVAIHLMFLHTKGSNNPLGTKSDFDKISFTPYFLLKDINIFLTLMIIFFSLLFYQPYMLMDSENFNIANPMMTPTHIQPEWYFLFAYAILRSIPNKLGGVIALIMSIFILMMLPFMKMNYLSKSFSKYKKHAFWMWISMFLILTFLGMMTVEDPFIIMGQMTTISYFLMFLIL